MLRFMSAETLPARRPSNLVLDTLGINGLFNEGLNGLLTQLAFPASYKLRELEGKRATNFKKGFWAAFDTLANIDILMLAGYTELAPTAVIALKLFYNCAVNLMLDPIPPYRNF